MRKWKNDFVVYNHDLTLQTAKKDFVVHKRNLIENGQKDFVVQEGGLIETRQKLFRCPIWVANSENGQNNFVV